MAVKLLSTGGGSVTLDVPSTASDFALTVPAKSATLLTNQTAGTVLQVLSATDSTERATTSTSFVTISNTLSVTITPTSISSKFLILVNTVGYKSAASFASFTIYRNSTNLSSSNFDIISKSGEYVTVSMSAFDSPATASSITYQVYLKSHDGNNAYINAFTGGVTTGVITVIEIGG